MAENVQDNLNHLKNPEDREARIKYFKEKQNEERQKKLEEIKAQALAAQKFKEQKEMERRQRLEDLRVKEDVRRQQVEERKKAINEAERNRLESIIKRNEEREARIEARRRNDRSSVYAFGSSTPRLLEPVEGMTGSFWGQRRATSTQNITTITVAPLTRRQSEREFDTGTKKRATSAGGLERSCEGALPTQSPAGCASGYVGRRKTDLMPTIPLRDSRDSPSTTPRKPFTRSPAQSRPSSSLSHQSTSSVASSVSMRIRPIATPRKPRPISIAVTGITTELKNGIVDTKKDNKPPLPKSRKSSLVKSEDKSKKNSLMSPSEEAKPIVSPASATMVSKTHPPNKIERKKEKSETKKEEKPDKPIEKQDKSIEKQDKSIEKQDKVIEKADKQIEKPDKSIEKPDNPIEKLDKPIDKLDKPIDKPNEKPVEQKTETNIESIKESSPPKSEINNDFKQEIISEVSPERQLKDKDKLGEAQKTETQKPLNSIQQFIENEKADHFIAEKPVQSVQSPSDNVVDESEDNNLDNSVTDMTASMLKVRINTEEEAKAALAERRRQAREEAERIAEMERLRKEEEARLEFEAQQREEEQQRVLIEQMRKAEQERLEEAIKEAQKREEEERIRKEEENRQKMQKEEADRKAREEAERQKAELQERLKHEEKEREARRKRVEAIMLRTRGKNNSLQQNEDKNDENKSEKMNGSKSDVPENGHKNGKEIETVDNIINVESFKNANTVTVDSTLGTDDTINSNNSWQHSNQDLLM